MDQYKRIAERIGQQFDLDSDKVSIERVAGKECLSPRDEHDSVLRGVLYEI